MNGIYKATVAEIGISGGIEKPCVQVRYDLHEILHDGEWTPIPPNDILAWHYLRKNSGELNTMQLHQFKEAFEWDGDDLRKLLRVAGMQCQVTIKEETYQGKTRAKVKWLNHINYSGYSIATDDSELDMIQNALAPQLRAMGTTKKPDAAPKAKKPPVAPPPPAPENTKGPCPACNTMDEAWAVCVENVHEDDAEREWFAAIAKVTNGGGVSAVKPGQWQAVAQILWDHIPF